MVLGSALRSRDEQYLVKYDSTTKIWRILDTWNRELATLEVEEEVADDHPAVRILTEGQFIALVKEASAIGILESALAGQSGESLEELRKTIEENASLKIDLAESGKVISGVETRYNSEKETTVKQVEEIIKLKEELVAKDKLLLRSESYAIKAKALDTVMKLAISEDVSKIIGITNNED